MSEGKLMLHVGGEAATYDALAQVPLPERTESYHPVPHQYVVDRAKKLFRNELELEMLSEAYGLARNGDQMFGVLNFKTETGEWGPSVGVRNSYDKSLRVGVCMGARVFVCDNMAFSGDAFTVLRKHTSKVMDDLDMLLMRAAREAQANYLHLSNELTSLKKVPLTLDAGFAALGRLYGRDALTSTQFSEAGRYWDKPPHPEHEERNVFAWYQSANHALKEAAPAKTLEAHAKLHLHALELVAAAA